MAEKLHFWQMTPFNELKSEIFLYLHCGATQKLHFIN